MKNFFLLAFLLFLISATPAFAQDDNPVDEDAPRITRQQRLEIRKLNQELRAKFEAVARRDPRYAQYMADFEALDEIEEPEALRKRLADFKNKHAGFREEVLRKAGVDERAYNLRVKKILPQIQLDDKGRIINRKPIKVSTINENQRLNHPGAGRPAPETFEITNFSNKWTYKDCSQAQISLESTDKISVYALTRAQDADCDDVKGARGTVLQVPAGVKSVTIKITLDKYSLWTSVSTAFGYASTYTAVGIRVKGGIIGSAKQTNYWRHKYLDTVWSVMGEDSADIEETGVTMSCTFKPLSAGEYLIQAYGRVATDTDSLAKAKGGAKVSGLKKITVTFTR